MAAGIPIAAQIDPSTLQYRYSTYADVTPDQAKYGFVKAPFEANGGFLNALDTKIGTVYQRGGQKYTAAEMERFITNTPTSTGADTSALIDYSKFWKDPADAMGALTRKQYESERAMFQPIEDRLRGMTTYENPEKLGLVMDDAIGSGGYVQTALNNNVAQQRRQAERYGVQYSGRQQAAMDSTNSLNKSTAIVDAANKIRQRLIARDEQIMMGAQAKPVTTNVSNATGGTTA